jgi:hypothetical protein
MRAWLQLALLPVLAIMVLAVAACARDPEPGTPAAAAEGERLMRQMSDRLAGLHAFRFTTQESIEQPASSTERRALQFTRTVTVQRPNSLLFEIRGTAPAAMELTAYYDGRTVALRDKASGVWAQAPAPGTIDEMLDDVAKRYALPVPIADVVYSVPYDAFIGRSTKGGFVGREVIDGARCAHLQYTDEFIDVQLWIPESGQPLPRRVKLTYKQTRGAPTARLDFTNWDLAPQIADGTFAFQAGAAEKRISFEQFTSRLLSGGQPARSTPAAAPGG